MNRNSAVGRDRHAPGLLGSVRSDEVLPAELFRERMGVSTKGWREMRRRGLRAVQSGKRQYILGTDALDYFRRLAGSEGQPQ
jgi:hypothetical protein